MTNFKNVLFSDLKTDAEKRDFFASGRGHDTGIVAEVLQEDLVDAYTRLADMQWQPISTAPTDEFILMYLPLVNEDYEIHLLAITEYGLMDMFNDITTYGVEDFTHWQPLPEPPTKEV